MVLYLLNGQKWCKEIEDFVRWSFHYDMWCKMWIFGEKMRRAMDLDKAVMLPGRRNLMEFLQDTFTLDDLNTVRRAQGMKGDGGQLLRKWVSRGYCTFTPIGHFDEEGSPMKRTNFSEQKHGAVIWITKKEAQRLKKLYMMPD